MGAGRIAESFRRRRSSTGLIPFVTAGFPTPEASLELMGELAAAGALALEVGIPFSDPIADGPEIQRASEGALRNGVGPAETLALVERFRRRHPEPPLVVMTYANPVLREGLDAFAERARAAGVDGIIVSDLPPDEAPEAWAALDRHGLATITLVAPTTPEARLPRVIERCRGFVYCLARTGVTGRSQGFTEPLAGRVATLRALTDLPIAVGFGISDAASARPLRGVADAVVVGAALMRALAEGGAAGVGRAASRAREIAAALE